MPRISAKTGLKCRGSSGGDRAEDPGTGGRSGGIAAGAIFDSLYDSYKGVIVFRRVKNGTIKRHTHENDGDRERLPRLWRSDILAQVSLFPCEELSAGMVGYVCASIKNVQDTRVGDTITDLDNPCAEPLPGYKKVTPMVYCGLYPADGAKYPDLRDALEKLQLNDAALYFEPETSVALGFGFVWFPGASSSGYYPGPVKPAGYLRDCLYGRADRVGGDHGYDRVCRCDHDAVPGAPRRLPGNGVY